MTKLACFTAPADRIGVRLKARDQAWFFSFPQQSRKSGLIVGAMPGVAFRAVLRRTAAAFRHASAGKPRPWGGQLACQPQDFSDVFRALSFPASGQAGGERDERGRVLSCC